MVQSVQPFAESQHPKELHEGSQELIYITHIVDPHNFFVQRSCHQALVKEMLREFGDAASLPKPTLNHVAEGKVYLMLSKADNMWQRGRVISIHREDPDNLTFLVFCIDFGSTESVNIEKLRLLPPARVHSPCPLAINCALANCEPKTRCWTTDDSYFMQNIIDNQQAILHVRHIRATPSCSARLEADVFTLQEGVSLARALLFHGRARLPNYGFPYPKITGVMERPRLFMSSNDLKPKAVEEVYITHIVSPDKFYVRKKHLKPVYERLCEELDTEYSISNTGNVYLPKLDMPYVVNIEKSKPAISLGCTWCRCVTVGLPGRGWVRVQLVDCGTPVVVHWTALRYIHQRFTTQRALASECHLAGVTPLNKEWSEASVGLLRRFEGRLLELHVEDARRDSASVTLYENTDPDDIVCVNTEMIKHKYAVTFGLFMFNKNSAVEDQVFTNKSLDEPPKRTKPAPPVQILQKNSKPYKVNEKELDAKDKDR